MRKLIDSIMARFGYYRSRYAAHHFFGIAEDDLSCGVGVSVLLKDASEVVKVSSLTVSEDWDGNMTVEATLTRPQQLGRKVGTVASVRNFSKKCRAELQMNDPAWVSAARNGQMEILCGNVEVK